MFQEKIAKIEKTFLGTEDHGIMTAYLDVSYGGSNQGIGGYALDTPVHDGDGIFIERVGTAQGMEMIRNILKVCGVDSWERLVGRTIFVLFNDLYWSSQPVGIRSLPTENGGEFIFASVYSDEYVNYLREAGIEH